jgi:hypothetical protein
MPIEGWRSLLETNWAGCVILHNLPFGFIEIHEAVIPSPLPLLLPKPIPVKVSRSSIYEMQKSAAKWHYHDFKA